MKRAFFVIALVALYVLHQDVWNWRKAAPILFGILPVGLSYHLVYTLAIALMMGLLVRYAWPGHLEAQGEGDAK
ncbi:MAG: hypothetical protein SF339_06860 [Blastocatellia bacterium]|nr:hypothetical protein [Blastocatellia bacterium]